MLLLERWSVMDFRVPSNYQATTRSSKRRLICSGDAFLDGRFLPQMILILQTFIRWHSYWYFYRSFSPTHFRSLPVLDTAIIYWISGLDSVWFDLLFRKRDDNSSTKTRNFLNGLCGQLSRVLCPFYLWDFHRVSFPRCHANATRFSCGTRRCKFPISSYCTYVRTYKVMRASSSLYKICALLYSGWASCTVLVSNVGVQE